MAEDLLLEEEEEEEEEEEASLPVIRMVYLSSLRINTLIFYKPAS
jgi:hypothetical protein